MVMEVVHEDMGEGNTLCIDHPYKNSNPGGICAFCLQEKLGNLVSSSFPAAIFASSSSSTSPSFGSDFRGTSTALIASSTADTVNGGNDCSYHGFYIRRSRLPFLLTHKKKKKKNEIRGSGDSASIVFKRSKSSATPITGTHLLNEEYAEDYSPRRKGFWSFLYLSKHSTVKTNDIQCKDLNFSSAPPSSTVGPSIRSKENKREDFVVVAEKGSPDEVAFDRKVSRSRSVGCGSKSFPGDLFERISTGFGDYSLRRAVSQKEGKAKVTSVHRKGEEFFKEKVKCGIFSGFGTTSNSHLVPSNENAKSIYATHPAVEHPPNVRNKTWGWAFASPIRAFGKPSSGKRFAVSLQNACLNLNATPSFLAVSS